MKTNIANTPKEQQKGSWNKFLNEREHWNSLAMIWKAIGEKLMEAAKLKRMTTG